MKTQATDEKKLEEYTLKCPRCGKIYTREIEKNKFLKGQFPKCCSSSCAHSRPRTKESRKKTSESVRKHYESLGKNREGNCVNCSPKSFRLKGGREIVDTKCCFCGKEIRIKESIQSRFSTAYCYECAEQKQLKEIQQYTKEGKRFFSRSRAKRISEDVRKRVKDGTHKGWQTRSIASFPEQFWKGVLETNNIEYKFNSPVCKRTLGVECSSYYFIDFLIDGYIDLEIDGKQHLYPERRASDENRDKLLTQNGFIVYRVSWNEVASKEGLEEMRKKVQTFLTFLQKCREG